MATIVQRAFDFEEDKALKLENEEFIRKLWYLGDWTTMRIGGLFSVGAHFSTIYNVSFEMGVCAGTLSPTSAASGPRHVVGVSWTGDPTPGVTAKNMTLGGTTTYPWYQFAANAARSFRRTPLGITANSGSANAYIVAADVRAQVWQKGDYDGGQTYVSLGGVPRAWPLIIEIDRSAGSTYTIIFYGLVTGTTTGHPFNWRKGDFFSALERRGTPSLHGVALTAQSQTLVISELFGMLDSIYLRWDRTAPNPLYVHALGACAFTRQGEDYSTFGGGIDNFESYYQGTLVSQGTAGLEWDSNYWKSYGVV